VGDKGAEEKRRERKKGRRGEKRTRWGSKRWEYFQCLLLHDVNAEL